jgi:hypothetical protein
VEVTATDAASFDAQDDILGGRDGVGQGLYTHITDAFIDRGFHDLLLLPG